MHGVSPQSMIRTPTDGVVPCHHEREDGVCIVLLGWERSANKASPGRLEINSSASAEFIFALGLSINSRRRLQKKQELSFFSTLTSISCRHADLESRPRIAILRNGRNGYGVISMIVIRDTGKKETVC